MSCPRTLCFRALLLPIFSHRGLFRSRPWIRRRVPHTCVIDSGNEGICSAGWQCWERRSTPMRESKKERKKRATESSAAYVVVRTSAEIFSAFHSDILSIENKRSGTALVIPRIGGSLNGFFD